MSGAKLAVVGVGRIGAVTAVGLAHLNHDVTGMDVNAARVAALSGGILREAEPGLRSALRSALRHRDLIFQTILPGQTALPGEQYEIALLCVDTPSLPSGDADLSQVFAAALTAARLLQPDGLLVTRSTVPPGTGDRLAAALASGGRPDIQVVHVPEFLREGRAWEDFRGPDRIVIGANSAAAAHRIASLFTALDRPIIPTDRRTAEFAKYAANAFLATSVSFANEMSGLCEALGVDAAAAFRILRADERIGQHAYLTPGLGFGGHCLPKDTAALEYLAAVHGRQLTQLRATMQVNRTRISEAVSWLRQVLGELDGRRVALAGLAFKPGTGDLRESPALQLARVLASEGAEVRGWDPAVSAINTTLSHLAVVGSIGEALNDAHALVVTQAWPGWRDLEPATAAALMAERVVYDAPAILQLRPWRNEGFILNRYARPAEALARANSQPPRPAPPRPVARPLSETAQGQA